MKISVRTKAIVYSAITVAAACFIYRHLYTGGWLTNPYYRLNDPDVLNLVVAIIEPMLVLVVIGYWFWRTPPFYRLLFISFLLQLLVCAGFATVIILFMLTWHPRLM